MTRASVGGFLGTSQTQDYVLLGALAVALYVLYNLVQGVKTVGSGVISVAGGIGTAYTKTVDALSSGLYALFGPDDSATLANNTFLMVNFPDGRHAVPAGSVTSTGLFQWSGYPAGSLPVATFQLVKDQSGAWYATDDSNFGTAPGGW